VPRKYNIIERLSACLIAVMLGTLACFGQLAFTDITLEAGTSGPTEKDKLGGHGVMFADVDQDGLPDLYITMIFNKPMPELLSELPTEHMAGSPQAISTMTATWT